MITGTETAVAKYLAHVRAELADLPAAEVEEIVEDIEAHLNEVAAELGEDVTVAALTARLGPPGQYASELRAAAGFGPQEAPAVPRPVQRRIALLVQVAGVLTALLLGLFLDKVNGANPPLVLAGLTTLLLAALVLGRAQPDTVDLPESVAVRRIAGELADALPAAVAGFLRALRPAWWLIRVAVLIIGLVVVLRTGKGVWLPVPIALLILVWFGLRPEPNRPWRWVVAVANAFAVGVAVALALSLWTNLASREDPQPVYYQPYSDGISHDGQPVRNIYVFDKDGKFVPQAHLYDEQGRPLTSVFLGCQVGGPRNTYPLPELQASTVGNCAEAIPTPPFTVVIPK